jgi:predicted amidohydrolase
MAKYTSSTGNFKVATFQNKTLSTYQENLKHLIFYIENTEAELIVAPELYLTNFDYEHFEEAAAFYDRALAELLAVVTSQIVVLTMTVKEGKNFFNRAVVIHEHKVLHRQEKYKLFKLGNEEKYFKAGSQRDIVPFEINEVKYAILICFELRFKELWKQVEGVDVVLVPARWGLSRKGHLDTLAEALAIVNQTFVVVSNSADEEMAASSAIISPWGERYSAEALDVLEKSIELKDVKRVRRLIQMY